MTTFFCIPTFDFTGEKSQFTIATGPVVINRTHDKVLLHVWESTGKWQFIWGRYDDTLTFRENAIKKAEEVIGNNHITLLESEPVVLFDIIDLHWYEEKTLLIHYKANIADETNIGLCQWFSLEEIRMLDAKNETSSENVKIISEQFLK